MAEPSDTDWAYAAGIVDGEGLIAPLRRSRRTLAPYPMPPEWLAEQEQLYWINRELNHRGTAEFVRKPMHSPRRINRERAQLWSQ